MFCTWALFSSCPFLSHQPLKLLFSQAPSWRSRLHSLLQGSCPGPAFSTPTAPHLWQFIWCQHIPLCSLYFLFVHPFSWLFLLFLIFFSRSPSLLRFQGTFPACVSSTSVASAQWKSPPWLPRTASLFWLFCLLWPIVTWQNQRVFGKHPSICVTFQSRLSGDPIVIPSKSHYRSCPSLSCFTFPRLAHICHFVALLNQCIPISEHIEPPASSCTHKVPRLSLCLFWLLLQSLGSRCIFPSHLK